MSEIREELKKYNLGFNSYSKMIGASRNTLMRYEQDPMSVTAATRRKIEVGMDILARENHVRPIMKDIGSAYSWYKGVHDVHVMNVLKYEKEFKKMFSEAMTEFND